MPELPEVEITRTRIAPLLVGRRVTRVQTGANSYLFITPPAVLRRRLTGRRVVSAGREGKYLTFGLEDGSTLVIHLGMTGQLFSSSAISPRLLLSAARRPKLDPGRERAFVPDAHTHLRLELEGGPACVYLRDVRKFGKVELVAAGARSSRLRQLGPDALTVGAELIARAAKRRRAPVKTLLLDQTVLAGVGNIYADEALFQAGICPLCPAHRLRNRDCVRLAEAIKSVLERAIALGGSSISDFVQPDGSDGAFQHTRRVYAREGEPCTLCGTAIRRVVIAQRSAHYCPRCQR